MKQMTDGIYQIETFYLNEEEIAACYLIEDNGEIAFFETNTNHAVPFLLEAVKSLGFKPEQVKYVIVSHIHLDHAGGTGLLMKQLPFAELVVHARGRKHMINPEKLIAGVKQIYGEKKYKKLYGEIPPIDKERVRSVLGTDTITLGNRSMDMYDSPGHAKHHMVLFDRQTRSVLSGDAFGIGYPRFVFDKFRLVFPSTSPVQFEPDRSLETFQKILDLNPSRVLLTHFGCIDDMESAHEQLKDWISFSIEIAKQRYREGYREHELYHTLYKDVTERFEKVIKEAAGKRLTPEEKEFLVLDSDLNAQGLAHYIKRLKVKINR